MNETELVLVAQPSKRSNHAVQNSTAWLTLMFERSLGLYADTVQYYRSCLSYPTTAVH